MAMNVLGVVGSLRRDSHNRKLLRAAGSQLPPDVQLTEYDRMKLIPPFDEDDEAAPPLPVIHWREAINRADAILFATPEYNSSMPGQLKNAIDWASRPFKESVLRNKPVAVIGASTGSFGAMWAQADLRKVLAAAGARVIDRELPVPVAHEAFAGDGTLIDGDLTLQLDGVLAELLDATRRRLAA
jgi:chromate reductase